MQQLSTHCSDTVSALTAAREETIALGAVFAMFGFYVIGKEDMQESLLWGGVLFVVNAIDPIRVFYDC